MFPRFTPPPIFFLKLTAKVFYYSLWSQYFIVLLIIYAVLNIIIILIGVAYFTLAERKIMASIQRRKGPNVVGLSGLLQPIVDGFKLAIKTKINPKPANLYLFSLAPMIILTLSLFSWFFVSLGVPGASSYFKNYVDFVIDLNSPNMYKNTFVFDKASLISLGWIIFYSGTNYVSVNILLILAISSFNVYGMILAGWASNSKYAFLGSLRSAAQMISYEVSLGLTILPVLMLAGGLLNLNDIAMKYHLTNGHVSWFFLYPCFIIFVVSMLAETNRTPFDLTEAEAELVAGYNVEYSSIVFAMFFLAEYSNMLLLASIVVILFYGAPSTISMIKRMCFFSIWFVVVRATYPRYKYNELMDLGWKCFLPIALSYVVFVASILKMFNAQLITT